MLAQGLEDGQGFESRSATVHELFEFFPALRSGVPEGGEQVFENRELARGHARVVDQFGGAQLGEGVLEIRLCDRGPRFDELGNRLDVDQQGVEERSRSEEHTYELQSLMRSSYADFC